MALPCLLPGLPGTSHTIIALPAVWWNAAYCVPMYGYIGTYNTRRTPSSILGLCHPVASPMEENLSLVEVDRNYLSGFAREVTQASFSKAEPNVLGSDGE